MAEIWKDISGFVGYYQISNYGRVKSLQRTFFAGKGYQTRSERILKPNKIGKGYLQVHLCKMGTGKMFLVSRLVALAFIPNPLSLPEVNHKDGDKENCHARNLEWITRQDNMTHAVKNNLMPDRRGGKGSGAVLKDIQVIEIRNRLIKGENKFTLANEFKVTWMCIHRIAIRETWQNL